VATQDLWNADALWPGQAIQARLKALVPELRDVLLVDEFDPSLTAPRQVPAAIVLLDALRVDLKANVYQPQPLNCDQDWMVALAVRSARADPGAQSAAIGVLLPKVVVALHAYAPPDRKRGFAWRTGPRPSYGKDVSYYPLIFTLQGVMAD